MRPLKKILLFGLLFSLLLYGLAKWGERWLVGKLEEKIADNGILKYRQMNISLLAGNVAFSDATIDWKWAEKGQLLSIYSPKISIDGIGWKRLYFDKILAVKSLQIEAPDVTLRDAPVDSLTQDSLAKDTVVNNTASSPPAKLVALEIEKISFDRGCVELYKGIGRTSDTPTAQVHSADVSLTDIVVGLLSADSALPVIGDADIRLHGMSVNDIQHQLFSIQQIHLNKRDSLIELEGMRLQQRDQPKAFFKKLDYKKAWLEMLLPSATMHGWQFHTLLKGALIADKMAIKDLEMQVQVNQNLTPDPRSRRPMPQEVLRNIGLKLEVDSVTLVRGKLVFESLGPGKTEVGILTFDPVSMTITNVTNDSSRIAGKKMMELNAVAYCQRKYPIYNYFWFDLSSPANAFSFKGNAADIPFVSMNSFIKPSTDVFFDAGTINRIKFDANGNDRVITGNLQMDYENLAFSLLDADRERRRMLSKVVDFIFVKEKNSSADKDFRPGIIYQERDPRLSFMNYWWTSIQSGIKTSVLDKRMVKKVAKREAKRKARKLRR